MNILKLKYEFKSTRFLSQDLVFKFWEFQVNSKATSKFQKKKKRWLKKLKQMHTLLLKKQLLFNISTLIMLTQSTVMLTS